MPLVCSSPTRQGRHPPHDRVFLCAFIHVSVQRISREPHACGWADPGKEGRLEAQGERLLQDLVKQEKSLVLKVEEAKAKAKLTIEQAQAEAARVLEEARAKADATAK